jgi:hypothetical protein
MDKAKANREAKLQPFTPDQFAHPTAPATPIRSIRTILQIFPIRRHRSHSSHSSPLLTPVKGRSHAGRFADLVALVGLALEHQPVLEPFAESVTTRFNEWLMNEAQANRETGFQPFTPDQLAWLNLIRDHIATSLSIDLYDFDYAPFSQRGGLGRAQQLFGDHLAVLLSELNERLAV